MQHNQNKNSRPFIVPIFIPQSGCPHKCAFCNQYALTGTSDRFPFLSTLQSDISKFLQYKRENRAATEISFFGGNFLGQNPEAIKNLLDVATDFVHSGDAQGIRFSTRPDTVDNKRLELISDYPVTTIEIGAQSMDDTVLALSGRGHSSIDTVYAAKLLKAHGYKTGLQMMVGLPGEDRRSSIETGDRLASLAPDFVRIYPTLVIKASLLEKWYREGSYEPLSLDQCIGLVKEIYLLFSEKNIPVIRLGLQANEGLDTGKDLVAGPYHPALGQMVVSEIFFDKAAAAIGSSVDMTDISLLVNPGMISTMRGQKNINITRLKKLFLHINTIDVIPQPDIGKMDVMLRGS